MKEYNAYKFRLYPTKEQHNLFIGWKGQRRFVWNYFLALNNETYKNTKKFVFYNEMGLLVPKLKKEHSWLNAPAHIFLNVCRNLDQAINTYLKHKDIPNNKIEYPKFKKKNKDYSGFTINQITSKDKETKKIKYKQIEWTDKHITIPKMGPVKWVYHRKIEGLVKSITIKQEANQWYVSVLAEYETIIKPLSLSPDENQVVGIDLGLKDSLSQVKVI